MWKKRICSGCDHLCLNNDDGLIHGCRAFPDILGIPDWIGNKHSHDTIIKGQTGDYVYMPAPKEFNIRGHKIEICQ